MELYEMTDEEFAETFVRFMQLHKAEGRVDGPLTKEDMLSFDVDECTKLIGDILREVLFSPEIDTGAWWKEDMECTGNTEEKC